VLVVDDFGVDWDHETGALMSELLDRRTANELLTIVTTNYKPAQLQEMLKARGWSRLMGRCMLVPVGGRDYRMEASA
jgi:DNA replication protein DnaC